MLADVIVGLGAAAAAQGDLLGAAHLLGVADAIRESTNHPRLPHQFQQDQTLAQLQATLDPFTFTHVWNAGRQLSLPEAIQLAQSVTADQCVATTQRD